MKKVSLILIGSLAITMTLAGCGSKTTDNVKPDAVVNSSNITSSQVKKADELQSKLQEFKYKLDKIQKDLDASEEKKKSDEGTTLDMLEYAGKQYTEWDKALNEIYGVLKQQLPPDDMKKLEIEEIKWIKEKETRAESAGNKFKGGSFEPVASSMAAAQATKERCYELLDKYMKPNTTQNNDLTNLLKLGAADKNIIKNLGLPENKSQAAVWGADGKEHQMWTYGKKGIKLDMIGTSNNQSVNMITITSPSNYKTDRNIGIGSSREEVNNAYKGSINKEESETNKIVVGNAYGGTTFNFEDNMVSSIFIGASAE